MYPWPAEAYRVASRVKKAIEAGGQADVDDAITMHLYQLSVELRRIPPQERMQRAREIAQHIRDNTRESLE